MAENEPRRIGVSIELKPHAYDPVANPELFDGVTGAPGDRLRHRPRHPVDPGDPGRPVHARHHHRDAWHCGLPVRAASPLYWPLIVVWAICYYGFTLGGPASATIGMRVMDLEMRTWYGAPAYFVLGCAHGLLFWVTVSFLTPFVLLVGFFNHRGRLLHDILLGTVVINNPARAQALRRPGPGAR